MASRFFRTTIAPPIELDDASGYWKGEVTLGERKLSISIYIDAALSDAQLEAAGALVSTLQGLEPVGRGAIKSRASGETVSYFFEFHCDEVPAAVPTDRSVDSLVSALKLVGIGVHKAEDDFSLGLDYSFGREHSDELLAVKLSQDGNVEAVDHES